MIQFLKKRKMYIIPLVVGLLVGGFFYISGVAQEKTIEQQEKELKKRVEEAYNPYGDKELHPETQKQLKDKNYQNVITDVQLSEKIQSGESVFVYFYSATCGYCISATPKVMQSAKELGISVHQLNVLEYDTAWKTFGIEGTPTLIHYKEGKETFRLLGEYEKNEYKKWFEYVKSR